MVVFHFKENTLGGIKAALHNGPRWNNFKTRY